MIPIRDINPTARFPLVTVVLIAVNIAVYLYQFALDAQVERSFILSYAFIPERLFSHAMIEGGAPVFATLFTSMFLHGGVFHIAGNMLYLWIFGNNVEDAMSRGGFLVFYLLCGVAAVIGHGLSNTGSSVPMIGASGAISGVLGAYLLLFPRAKVLTLVMLGFYLRTLAVPAMIILSFWFLFQFLSMFTSSSGGGGVAWFAHIAGFIAGLALIGLFKRRSVPFGGERSRQNL